MPADPLIGAYAVGVKIKQLSEEAALFEQLSSLRKPSLMRQCLDLREALLRFLPSDTSLCDDSNICRELFDQSLRIIKNLPDPPDFHLVEIGLELKRCQQQIGLLHQAIRNLIKRHPAGPVRLLCAYNAGIAAADTSTSRSDEDIAARIAKAGLDPQELLPQMPAEVLERICNTKNCPERWAIIDVGLEQYLADVENEANPTPHIKLNALEQTIVKAVRSVGHRVTGDALLTVLNNDFKMQPALGRFKETMAWLVRANVLSNRRGTGGYGLPDWD